MNFLTEAPEEASGVKLGIPNLVRLGVPSHTKSDSGRAFSLEEATVGRRVVQGSTKVSAKAKTLMNQGEVTVPGTHVRCRANLTTLSAYTT